MFFVFCELCECEAERDCEEEGEVLYHKLFKGRVFLIVMDFEKNTEAVGFRYCNGGALANKKSGDF